MCSKLLLASVATIGLLLAGPQKASAQVLNACVTSIGNISILAGPNAPFPGGTKTTLSQTPGAIAARQYNCGDQTVAVGGSVSFVDSGIGFGTTLPTGTMSFTSFVLQPGIYQFHLTISNQVSPPDTILAIPQEASPQALWLLPLSHTPLSGDRLFSVTTANTSVALQVGSGPDSSVSIITSTSTAPTSHDAPMPVDSYPTALTGLARLPADIGRPSTPSDPHGGRGA